MKASTAAVDDVALGMAFAVLGHRPPPSAEPADRHRGLNLEDHLDEGCAMLTSQSIE